MSDRTIDFLRELVAIDSVNPSLVPGGAGEAQAAAAAACEMRRFGLDVALEEASPGRPNAIGVLEGRGPGPALVLCGHLDTVGVTGMDAPFDPVLRDGRVYGRGSQDMKGGVAAMIGAARLLAERGGLAAGRLIVAAVADEECESLGVQAFVARWRADAAVVTEPTDLDIGVAHKGFAWVEVTTEGRAAHGSRPADGRDAILRMGRVLVRLESLDRALGAGPRHALVGPPSLHASLISGGRELSSYPDHCALQMERRTIPGEDSRVALPEVERVLDALRGEDPEFAASARYVTGRAAYEIDGDHPLVAALGDAARSVGLASNRVGVSFWADSAILGGAGIPAVLFGPGGAGLHGLEEYVRVDDVLACQEALAGLAGAYCV
jgi:acetylornithine deacetylase